MILTERDKKILNEVIRFKCVLGRQIKVLAGFTGTRATDRRLRVLIDNGYLERKRRIYGIAGLYLATNKARKELETNLTITEPRLDQIKHDIAVVDTVLYFTHFKNIQLNQVTTEKEIRNKLGFGVRGHVPDFTFTQNCNIYCVEVELNVKAKDKLMKNIQCNFKTYDAQYWVIADDKPKIKENILIGIQQYPNMYMISYNSIESHNID